MDFKGSKTEKNLYRTFAGESRARNKYNLYAEKAKEEGYEWVADVFNITAHNEFAHAREVLEWLKLLGSTKDNLKASMLGETSEYKDIYIKFMKEAEEEGFKEVAKLFKELIKVEEHHENRFKSILERMEKGTMFKGDADSKWICTNCGYIYEGAEVPLNCPLCAFPRAYYKPYCENTKE